MEIRSYNSELAYANLMFLNIFNNITIERDKKPIKVSCEIGNRSRILKNLENATKEGMYSLPLIVVTRRGMSKNSERLANLHNEVKYETGSLMTRNYNLYTPVPIDINYDVSIMSKYPGDIDRIMSNFIVFFNKDVFVSCTHPKFTNLKYSSQVVMEDSITEENPEELDPSQDDIITTTCSFIFKTYIFSGRDKMAADGEFSIKQNPGHYISSWISVDVDTGESALVSADISGMVDTVYDGFVPVVSKVDIGFYAVPRTYSFENYFADVDNGTISQPDVDRMIWKIRDNEIIWENNV